MTIGLARVYGYSISRVPTTLCSTELSKKNAPKRDVRLADSRLLAHPAGIDGPPSASGEEMRFDAGCHRIKVGAHAQKRCPERGVGSTGIVCLEGAHPDNCKRVGNPPRLSAFLFRRAAPPEALAPRKDPKMYDRERWPEQRASTGLPVGIMLLSALAITAYLAVGGAYSDGGDRAVVYIPQTTGK